MGLQDRDYMRRTYADAPVPNRVLAAIGGWRGILATAAAVIGVASAGVWLYRDTRSLVGDFGSEEGSLVVNINTASQEDLETIPGIGPTRAAQIIAGRPYGSVEELAKIAGISPAQVANMRPFITTESETAERPSR
jgi:hypothetical protein